MLFITGHRAVGKSAVGKLLEEHNYWFFDVGPFWRNLRDKNDPLLPAEVYANRMTDDYLATYIAEQYRNSYAGSLDIAIGGYRSLPEINYLASRLDGVIYPQRQTNILYIDCPFEQALVRYQKREKIVDGREQLVKHYQYELAQGLGEIASASTFHLNNNNGLERLGLEVSILVNHIQKNGYFLGKEKQ